MTQGAVSALLWGIASSPRKTGMQLELALDPGRCKSLDVGCVTVCAQHCQFSGSEAPWLEVKCYENFPKHRSTAVSGPAHETDH